jgi:hypothetical protein
LPRRAACRGCSYAAKKAISRLPIPNDFRLEFKLQPVLSGSLSLKAEL